MFFADKFSTAMRSDLFRAASEVEEVAAGAPTACGYPPPLVLSADQARVIEQAVADIRKVAFDLDLRDNTEALAARSRMSSAKGKRPPLSVRNAMY